MNWDGFRWRSLSTKVTLFTVVIFVLCMWTLTIFASRTLHDDMELLLGEQQFSIASMIAADINQELDDRLKALERLAMVIAPAIRGDTRSVQGLLEHRPFLLDLFSGGVMVVSADGTAIADVPEPQRRMGVNYFDRGFMAVALQEGKSVIGRPVVGSKLNASIVTLVAPVRDAQGTVSGAVAGVIDLGRPNFLDRIVQGGYGRSGTFFLAAPEDKMFVAAWDKDRIKRMSPVSGISPLLDKYAHGFEGYGVLVNASGEEELTAAKGIPRARWFFGVAVPAAEAFAPIRNMRYRIFLAASLLTLLVAGLTWWMIRRQLAPMLSTARTLATLSDTNPPALPLPVVRQDEIGHLVGGFNRLLDALGKQEAALRASESQLSFLVSSSPVTLYRCRAVPPYGATYISPNVARNIGYRPEQFVEDDEFWAKNIHPDDRPRIFEELPRLFEAGVHQHEYRFRVANGTYRWMQDEMRLMRTEPGEISGIVGSWADVTQRKLAEALVIQGAAEVRAAYRKLADAQEQERRVLARELHDQVGQNLAALNLVLSRLDAELTGGPDREPRKRVGASLALVEDTTRRIRDLMSNLRPPMLDDYGLFATLRWWVHESAVRSGMSIELTGGEATPRLPVEMELMLFRVFQEAMLNAIKHSGASSIAVAFEAAPGGVRLQIDDDGCGMVGASGGSEHGRPSWGLQGMRERMESLGGHLRIESASPGIGTRVVAEVARERP